MADHLTPAERAAELYPDPWDVHHGNPRMVRGYGGERAAYIRGHTDGKAEGANALADLRKQRDEAREEVERLIREQDAMRAGTASVLDATLRSRDRYKAALEGDRTRISEHARGIASYYPPSSDGWNTFIMFANWVDALPPPDLDGEASQPHQGGLKWQS